MDKTTLKRIRPPKDMARQAGNFVKESIKRQIKNFKRQRKENRILREQEELAYRRELQRLREKEAIRRGRERARRKMRPPKPLDFHSTSRQKKCGGRKQRKPSPRRRRPPKGLLLTKSPF